MKVLCLDIEGGFGGSSRSLYFFLKNMDRGTVQAEVWCKRQGPAAAMYAELGIPCRVLPPMPKFTSVPRLSRNVLVTGRGLFDFYRAGGFRRELAAAAAGFDLVHFNHEGLYWLASWLRPRVDAALTMHIRTRPPVSAFARVQARAAEAAVHGLVFITENEREHFKLLGGSGRGEIIYNIVEDPPKDIEPWPGLPADGRFRIGYLANYSFAAGNHLLVECARELRAMGRRDIVFAMAGRMGLTRSMPGELGRLGRAGGTLADYAAARGVADDFVFLGHVPEPERVMCACDAVAKFNLGLCPWSRDLLEAMSLGKPVLSIGSYSRFLEHGQTGVLLPEFDARAMAREITRLADDPAACAGMGREGRERVLGLCSGRARAADLLDVWRQALEGRNA